MKDIAPVTMQVWIQPHSLYAGKRLSDIPLPEGCYLLGLVRDHRLLEDNSDLEIEINDYILAVALDPTHTAHLDSVLKRIEKHIEMTGAE
ncbi:MAG: hypothetical protein HC818_06950 [Synechococcaceae cyanobacterium RM1_1_27]|nr:hypothetical protein [Synechococcaceae cyanobacterium SM2_3_2]NJO86288.1 hypothetical protein [Synechococcaceae cyanobacterium RM1_1_27]